MRYPLRPFTVSFVSEPKCIRADLRDHSGKLWFVAQGYTYGEVNQKAEAAAFSFGGQIVGEK